MKKIILISTIVAASSVASAQNATDGYILSQSDLKGTARSMSMAGAFGALGGDLSTLSQNPGGIGVYRRSELGFTLDLDAQTSNSISGNSQQRTNYTKLLLNNIGGVAAINLHNNSMPFLNLGFTYQKAASFNKRFEGIVPGLNTSVSNYIAGIANTGQAEIADLKSTDTYYPYYPNDGGYQAPWLTILGYDSYMITPEDPSDPACNKWYGQFGNLTSGTGHFESWTRGGVDEYNLALGGNIANTVFWGMTFGIVDTNVVQETWWDENLNNAYVADQNEVVHQTGASTSLYNYYKLDATGFNYKLGVIVKPIQELRLGFAFNTPTWYAVNQVSYGQIDYNYNTPGGQKGDAQTNEGQNDLYSYNFRTPWKLIFSAAGVIGGRFIISADYEWEAYNGMKFSRQGYQGYWNMGNNDYYSGTNSDIRNYYRQTNTLRIGAEYRPLNWLSARAGFSWVSSPVRNSAKNGNEEIYLDTYSTRPQFVWDNDTYYATCGLGFNIKKFYADLAYVYKYQSSDYHAFADPVGMPNYSPQAKINTSHSQVVLSMGFKF